MPRRAGAASEWKMKKIKLPFTESEFWISKRKVAPLRSHLHTGTRRIKNAGRSGGNPLPWLEDSVIYYVSPTAKAGGNQIRGPTTTEDGRYAMVLMELGAKISIGRPALNSEKN